MSHSWLAAVTATFALVAPLPLGAQETPPVSVPVPAPLPPPWRFGVELGVTDISGNRDLQLFAGSFVAEHQRRDLFIFNGKVESRYGESNHIRSVDNSALRFRFDWRPSAPASPYVGLDIERDAIRNIDMRMAGGFGTNFNLVARDDRRTTISFGVIFELENRSAGITPNRVEDVRGHLRFAWFSAVSPDVRVEFNGKVQPALREPADYHASADAAVTASLNRRLALRTRYEWKRDTRPAPGVASRDDRLLTVALAVSW